LIDDIGGLSFSSMKFIIPIEVKKC